MQTQELVERFLPRFDVSDTVACTVEAPQAPTWEALMEADLMEVGRRKPLAGMLGAVRMLPELAAHLLHGERPPGAPERLRLKDTAAHPSDEGGWILLGEIPGRELALGLVGRFWKPVIEYARVDAAAFGDFNEPGWAKTVYGLSAEPLGDDRTMLTATMRTLATDDSARRWFRRYWTFGVGSGAHVLVNGLLEMVRDQVEEVRLSPPPVSG